jgi:excisionase family DNA binding protein
MPARNRPLMEIDQVAGYLGVSVRHIRRLVAEQRGPFIKWGLEAALRPQRHRRVGRRAPAAGAQELVTG